MKKFLPIGFVAYVLLLCSPEILAFSKRVLPAMFGSYLTALKTKPILTKAITGGVTAMLGDVVTQIIERVSCAVETAI